ncbi:MAG: AzlC family ABC transporter permease [Spirochaetaceae bacterium]|jgi:4-azaleucine resistance transporter AzlC|nr:AzlC family ABC transporter permease [Spirochaetaceae bacterium]
MKNKVFARAFTYSIPVLLGYIALGGAFGLMLSRNYPWWLALVMSIVMYAGAGQIYAVSIFAAGAGIADAMLIQFVLNARHIAYGITMLKKYNLAGKYKPYLIFALSDETFALLSSLPDLQENAHPETLDERNRFMFYVSLLDQGYWVAGCTLGALAGSIIPLGMEGIDFALTALFIVLLIEQITRLKKATPFIVASLLTVAAVILLPNTISLLGALAISLAAVHFISHYNNARAKGDSC